MGEKYNAAGLMNSGGTYCTPSDAGLTYSTLGLGTTLGIDNTYDMKDKETKKAYIFTYIVPGSEADEIDVFVKDTTLHVVIDPSEEFRKYYRQLSFTQSLTKNANLNSITSSIRKGILTVTILKQAADITAKVVDNEG